MSAGIPLVSIAIANKNVSRMVKVSDAYSLEDFCEMDEEDMRKLLTFYGPNQVPQLSSLKSNDG